MDAKRQNLATALNAETCQLKALTEVKRGGQAAAGKIRVHAWLVSTIQMDKKPAMMHVMLKHL